MLGFKVLVLRQILAKIDHFQLVTTFYNTWKDVTACESRFR